MKFHKILLLGYDGSELEEKYWQRVDAISDEKVMLATDDESLDSQLKDADCLLVKLGAKVPS
ncbi:MAG: hypothetical protein HN679_00005, partial [Candidatus Pacebacteria bacterium]|nr:hypothetical protein [Candidatus Paceibacterota bacterium]